MASVAGINREDGISHQALKVAEVERFVHRPRICHLPVVQCVHIYEPYFF